MDLLAILQMIGMLLKIFGIVLLAMTLAVTTGTAIYLLWQHWFQKSDSAWHHRPHKALL
ncbi:MAG TPA: hypothetical protein VKH45_05125 [Candidatus Acidoferrum sp.]|nr:hypothetical protein [Candidatus Acidoferrum sp.]